MLKQQKVEATEIKLQEQCTITNYGLCSRIFSPPISRHEEEFMRKNGHFFQMFIASALLGVGFVMFDSLAIGDESKPPDKPSSLETAIKVLKDETATDAQKDRLKGKMYEGKIQVDNVESVRKDKEEHFIIVVKLGNVKPNNVEMRFETSDMEKALQIKVGDHLRLTGRLYSISSFSYFTNVTATESAYFSDVTIQEISKPKEKEKEKGEKVKK
jgi:hypothetical protein